MEYYEGTAVKLAKYSLLSLKDVMFCDRSSDNLLNLNTEVVY